MGQCFDFFRANHPHQPIAGYQKHIILTQGPLDCPNLFIRAGVANRIGAFAIPFPPLAGLGLVDDASLAQQKGRAVADPDHIGHAGEDGDTGAGRVGAHISGFVFVPGRIFLIGLDQRVVERAGGVEDLALCQLAQVVALLDPPGNAGAGLLAFGTAAHSIGHNQQNPPLVKRKGERSGRAGLVIFRATDQIGVLVDGALLSLGHIGGCLHLWGQPGLGIGVGHPLGAHGFLYPPVTFGTPARA